MIGRQQEVSGEVATVSARWPKWWPLYVALKAAALEGRPCPGNTPLAVAGGFRSTSSVVRWLKRMEAADLLRIERRRNERRITLPLLGRAVETPGFAAAVRTADE